MTIQEFTKYLTENYPADTPVVKHAFEIGGRRETKVDHYMEIETGMICLADAEPHSVDKGWYTRVRGSDIRGTDSTSVVMIGFYPENDGV